MQLPENGDSRKTPKNDPFHVVIIGGGPAGLIAAEVVAKAGIRVDIYDTMPSVGRKFLLAGVGGMNITHAEPFNQFFARYGEAATWMQSYLHQFDANNLRDWVHSLGVQTFVGSSGRVFPTDMKAAPLLRAWLHRLRELDVSIHPRHRWLDWNDSGELVIENRSDKPATSITVKPDATLLTLGGASWARLGSDGSWVSLLQRKGISISDLVPSNCGFETPWSNTLIDQFAGTPLHTVEFSVLQDNGGIDSIRGEAIITAYGIEGSAIYALSAKLRNQIDAEQQSNLMIDLLPDLSLEHIIKKLQKPRGKNSMSNYLRKQFNLSQIKIALLRELSDKAVFENPAALAQALKQLSLNLTATRPIDEAISTAGGVKQQALTSDLMLQELPGVFCAGEMLDWEAPTGGYLLTACFATGYAAGKGIVRYLNSH